MDKYLTTIIVSNIVSLRQQGRIDEIETYFYNLNKQEGVTKEEFDVCVSLAIANLQRLGKL